MPAQRERKERGQGVNDTPAPSVGKRRTALKGWEEEEQVQQDRVEVCQRSRRGGGKKKKKKEGNVVRYRGQRASRCKRKKRKTRNKKNEKNNGRRGKESSHSLDPGALSWERKSDFASPGTSLCPPGRKLNLVKNSRLRKKGGRTSSSQPRDQKTPKTEKRERTRPPAGARSCQREKAGGKKFARCVRPIKKDLRKRGS